jgi:chromosome segregation ATPase
MGGKIPRNIKEKVIRQWLDGLTRESIAKENDIGAGTVTGIIQEARIKEEYQDIDLLRQVSLKSKEEGLELPELGFAIRLKRIRQENGINEDQIESIIQDFATYCLRHDASYDTVIKSGREALYLEEKYRVPIERIPEYIIEAKKTTDNLEDQRQEILRQKQQAREDRDIILQQLDEMRQRLDKMRQQRDAIVAELEKHGKEIPSIVRIRELEAKLDEANKQNEYYEKGIKALTKKLDIANQQELRLEADGVELDARWKDTASRLLLCRAKKDELRNKNLALRQYLQVLFILFISLTMELSVITEYKRRSYY